MKAPEFWRRGHGGLMSALLRPLGWLYEVGGQMNQTTATSVKASVPVLCIGNVVAGGAGKTPVAIDLGQRLLDGGVALQYLSRGYGGSETGPHAVDIQTDAATRVGDEPLLLSRVAKTWVSTDRVQGAIAMVEAGAEVIVMDDGLQNHALVKDISVLVIDGTYGIGNGRVMPAGPLREPLAFALKKSNAVVLIGDDLAKIEDAVKNLAPNMVLLKAKIQANARSLNIEAKAVHAFCGIGHPEKFFKTLEDLNCNLLQTTPFADHHVYSQAELSALVAAAKADQAVLVTTEKDYVRLDPTSRDAVKALPISLQWDDEERLKTFLEPFFSRAS